ncbi:hypothetical protein HLH36_08090 [Gluconacetobacter aggeris]|uniref:Transposase n=1 Tax=Gluconacetobacter aggeris TaxID=1286186 RepID=A0A7W4NVZ3_9PROT|nr:hypothetical protein [Gluconacetobacter aggeris]
MRTMGARPAIPPKRRDAAVACPQWAYRNRHLVEKPLGLSEGMARRRNPIRKTAVSLLAVFRLAAAADWIKIEQALGRGDCGLSR